MARSPSRLGVVLLNRQRRRRVRLDRLRRILRAAARDLGVSGELAVVLAGDRTLRSLNARYRGKETVHHRGEKGDSCIERGADGKRREHGCQAHDPAD